MLNHVGTEQLETNRLILRRHKMTDADDMYNNWVTDPEVCRFWSWEPHKNIEETKGLLAGWIEEYKKKRYVPLDNHIEKHIASCWLYLLCRH